MEVWTRTSWAVRSCKCWQMVVHIGRPLLSVISEASLRSRSFSSADHVCILPFAFRNKPPSVLENGVCGESGTGGCRSMRKAAAVRFACAEGTTFVVCRTSQMCE